MPKPRIALQLDTDPQPSVFDSVVAIDAGAEQLLRHGGVTPENVTALVHGAIFTRGGDDLKSTAILVGGSSVPAAEAILQAVRKAFVGPCRVSVLMDANGCNSTAAAAVLAAAQHLDLSQTTALVLAATGPVGGRVVRLLARAGAQVRAASRSLSRAEELCSAVAAAVPAARLQAIAAGDPASAAAALSGAQLVIAAGAAGVLLLRQADWAAATDLRVAIDLNAVPPLGIEGVGVVDKRVERDGKTVYGAIGVGGSKMKIHRAAIARLFERNDLVLDAEQVFDLAQAMS